MDIRLHTSLLLILLRAIVISLVALAIINSAIDNIFKLLLCGAVLVQFTREVLARDSVCRIHLSPRDNSDQLSEQAAQQQKIIVELTDKRRIEFTLKAFYNLWWIQILYLSSTHMSHVLLILPDSCSAEERRHLRKILNGQH